MIIHDFIVKGLNITCVETRIWKLIKTKTLSLSFYLSCHHYRWWVIHVQLTNLLVVHKLKSKRNKKDSTRFSNMLVGWTRASYLNINCICIHMYHTYFLLSTSEERATRERDAKLTKSLSDKCRKSKKWKSFGPDHIPHL